MYEKLVYVGAMSHVTARDFEFVKNQPTPVPPSVARKLLRSSEFITERDFLASQQVPVSDAPAEEPVVTAPVNAPADDSSLSPIQPDKE